MHMFESLKDQMGGGKDRNLIDKQHVLISNLIKRQSEHDVSRGSMHKEKCLAFSLALSQGSKFLIASLNGLAQSRKAKSR